MSWAIDRSIAKSANALSALDALRNVKDVAPRGNTPRYDVATLIATYGENVAVHDKGREWITHWTAEGALSATAAFDLSDGFHVLMAVEQTFPGGVDELARYAS